jgi:hypothetical protein
LDSQNGDDVWPRFIIIESVNPSTPVAKLYPFATEKDIAVISDTVLDVKS